MVAAAGAGAASSSMKITGTMDTSNIDRGFARVGQGFQGIKGNAKSFGADMKRVSITVAGLAKKMITLGIAGVAALVGIASKAPAVAPAMAKISVSFGKIQRSLGEALAPAFEKVAGWLDKLAVWIDNNKEKIGDLAIKFLDWGSALAEKVWPWLEKIGNWAVEHPGLFAGILAGLALGPSIIAGISSVASLVSVLGAVTISPTLLAALGLIALIGGTSIAVGGGLVEQFKIGQGGPVPIPEAAKQQIANASPEDYLTLANLYGDRTTGSGFGPERTPEIDVATGELYSTEHLTRDIINTVVAVMAAQDRRGFQLQYNASTWP